jgi:adenine-specific DNA-methyltransferase
MVREYSPAGWPRGGYPPRSYLSPANAAHVDAINRQLGSWEQEGRLTSQERALLRHDLVLAVNRVANIAGTYGHFRSKWGNGALGPLTLLPSDFWPERAACHVVRQGRAEDVAVGLAADLCYLDPPYTKRQYAANYHLIETLARGDEPEAIGVSGLRPWRDQYSNFCSKLKLRAAFTAIIRSMRCSRFLISYSEDGLLSKQELFGFLQQFGTVQLMEFDYPRFRSNDSPLSLTGTEYLFSLQRTC